MADNKLNYTLNPCPFCGGEGKYEKRTECIGHGDYLKVGKVRCEKCKSTGPSFDNWEFNEKELEIMAVAAWNYRTKKEGIN